MSLCGVTTTPSVPRCRRLVMTDNPSLTPFLYSLQPLVYSLWFPLLNADYWLLSSVLILHFFASPAHPLAVSPLLLSVDSQTLRLPDFPSSIILYSSFIILLLFPFISLIVK